ncbi:MAG: DNA polymerase III subunit delta [Roseburia sp.]|nr:DNA polymerase III subunit delta [Roseburia sp.]
MATASSSAAASFEGIRSQLKAGKAAPVYILHGEESFFVDELVRGFEGLLSPDDREFNLYVLSGADITEVSSVTDLCRRFPMMADRQVVIVKDAQTLGANQLAKFASYLAEPVESTVLVIAGRGVKLTGREFTMAAKKGGAVVFESKKVTDATAPTFIGNYLKNKGLTSEPKALEMLCDFVGTDLSRLYNEVDKLATLLPQGARVTPEVVERNIGVSREFNTFELVDAIAARDAAKAFRILAYFRANPKAAPLVLVTASVFGFFADLLAAYYADDKSEHGLMEATGIRYPMGIRRIRTGMKSYSAVRVVEIITAIRQYDAMSKGLDSRQGDQALFHDLVFHILTATGKL